MCNQYFLSSGQIVNTEMRNCGKGQGKKEWWCRFYAANRIGSATHCTNHKPKDSVTRQALKGTLEGEIEEDQLSI